MRPEIEGSRRRDNSGYYGSNTEYRQSKYGHSHVNTEHQKLLQESNLVKESRRSSKAQHREHRESRRSRRNHRVQPVDSERHPMVLHSKKPKAGMTNGTTVTDNSNNNSNNVSAQRSSRKRKGNKNTGLMIVPPSTPDTETSLTPNTPQGQRGSRDMRSPGVAKTPKNGSFTPGAKLASESDPIPDLITQTDRFGNAITPRSDDAIEIARKEHPSGPKPALHVDGTGKLTETDESKAAAVDPCDSLLDSIRLMCCCLLPEDSSACAQGAKKTASHDTQSVGSEVEENKVRLLPKHHPDDVGKKCLVLDLDETLVHSSFRAVPGADFVIPVQIEDVVHFVYVAKRPGVDEFLTEMAKHYEIVIYTASLNKYADPLLDLLDPNNVIRSRLFRESCVYYEGNYVKDLSLLDRDLSQSIIVDNSPSSYIFHPENAIDCSSFIDDPNDRELDQIAAFLTGIKDLKDVRPMCHQWREYPHVNIPPEIQNNDPNQ